MRNKHKNDAVCVPDSQNKERGSLQNKKVYQHDEIEKYLILWKLKATKNEGEKPKMAMKQS